MDAIVATTYKPDGIRQFCEIVRDAAEREMPLRIQGGNTKAFLGRPMGGVVVDVRGYAGIVEYHPSELVVTARAGTALAELEAVLAEHGQMLGFEPPHHGAAATIGGTLCCALSGPRRPFSGAARDFTIGVSLVDGRARPMRFGGQVIKNVAGFDISRAVVGAMGTLGLLTDVSLKVLPRPAAEETLRIDALPAADAIRMANDWILNALPVSATCLIDNRLHVRLSGSAADVRAARTRLRGLAIDVDGDIWRDLREHRLDFFQEAATLWRLSVAPLSPVADLAGRWAIEWNGGQRWLASDAPADEIRAAATAAGGHATLFRSGNKEDRLQHAFHPLTPGIDRLHRNLKSAFDPLRILNRGRMYEAI